MSAVLTKAAERAADHPAECECFDCCLLIGAGEKRPGTPMMEAIKAAIEGSLYANS